MNILIVEDEILIQKSLTKLLEKKGATVTATASGKEAISLIKDNEYDKVICDLMLNDISGFDILEESKSKFSLDEIKVKFIIMTAYSSEQVHQKVENYGCKFLTKPFENLADAIKLFMS